MYSKYSLPLLYTIITVPEYYVPKKYCKIINSRFIKFYTMCSLFCNLESLYSCKLENDANFIQNKCTHYVLNVVFLCIN